MLARQTGQRVTAPLLKEPDQFAVIAGRFDQKAEPSRAARIVTRRDVDELGKPIILTAGPQLTGL
jgi:hypothetical protein